MLRLQKTPSPPAGVNGAFMNIIREFNKGAWLCVCLRHICRWALMDAIESDHHGNGVKPLFQHKDPGNVTFTVLPADALFMRVQRRRLKNKLAPEKAHLLLQHVTS